MLKIVTEMKLPDPDKVDVNRKKAEESTSTVPAVKLPPGTEADTSTADEPGKKLTEDEQMALYEKELQENDWGHQPC